MHVLFSILETWKSRVRFSRLLRTTCQEAHHRLAPGCDRIGRRVRLGHRGPWRRQPGALDGLRVRPAPRGIFSWVFNHNSSVLTSMMILGALPIAPPATVP